MKKWFGDSQIVDCSFERALQKLNDIGVLFTETTKHMPGLTEVELLEEGSDFVTIRTNEGVMKRTNIISSQESGKIVLEFDEAYLAGKGLKIKSHYQMLFIQETNKVKYELTISGIQASGILGFFYKKFGKASIGKAVINAFKTYLEGDRLE